MNERPTYKQVFDGCMIFVLLAVVALVLHGLIFGF